MTRSRYHRVVLPAEVAPPPDLAADPSLDEERDMLDAALFRYWVKLASRTPARVARAISACTTPAQYRAALIMLAREDRLNLPYPPEGPAP